MWNVIYRVCLLLFFGRCNSLVLC